MPGSIALHKWVGEEQRSSILPPPEIPLNCGQVCDRHTDENLVEFRHIVLRDSQGDAAPVDGV